MLHASHIHVSSIVKQPLFQIGRCDATGDSVPQNVCVAESNNIKREKNNMEVRK